MRISKKGQQTFVDGESGTSTIGSNAFPVAELGMRVIKFCCSSSDIVWQFLAFTFRSGGIAGAGVLQGITTPRKKGASDVKNRPKDEPHKINACH